MRQVMLGIVIGALVAGGFAACSNAIGQPTNDNSNGTCNCPVSPLRMVPIDIACTDIVTINKDRGWSGVLLGKWRFDQIVSVQRVTSDNDGSNVRSTYSEVYQARGGGAVLPCVNGQKAKYNLIVLN